MQDGSEHTQKHGSPEFDPGIEKFCSKPDDFTNAGQIIQMATYFGIKGMELKKVKIMAAREEETRARLKVLLIQTDALNRQEQIEYGASAGDSQRQAARIHDLVCCAKPNMGDSLIRLNSGSGTTQIWRRAIVALAGSTELFSQPVAQLYCAFKHVFFGYDSRVIAELLCAGKPRFTRAYFIL